MKKVLFSLSLLVSFTFVAVAQSAKYMGAMQEKIAAVDSVRSEQGLLDLSATFERIGDAEKTQWLPYYYA
ncbi:MAG TPA: hypothetical protein VEX65_11150, partial [Flavisolibacter sp.]|nr:hypothetical protein [Flavisolibacter sp.]